MRLTREKIEKAKHMRERGYNWQRIGRLLECNVEAVRRRIDHEWAERRRQAINEARRVRLNSTPRFKPLAVPSDVLAAREQARSQSLTINQMILGDPPPGRSALDRIDGASHA